MGTLPLSQSNQAMPVSRDEKVEQVAHLFGEGFLLAHVVERPLQGAHDGGEFLV